MTTKDRWALTAAIALPVTTFTAYLLWAWPLPRGSSVIAQTGPYALSLLTGLPFVWRLTRQSGRLPMLLAFLAGGFIFLWVYALAVLCGVRDVCL